MHYISNYYKISIIIETNCCDTPDESLKLEVKGIGFKSL